MGDTAMTETKTDFFHREVHVWGEEYVYDLVERGYTPILTTEGWRWMIVTNVQTPTR